MIKKSSFTSDYELAKASRNRHRRLFSCLYKSLSESDVRQYFLALYDLDLVGNLERYRIDYVHPEIWLEFKYQIDMTDRAVRCRVIAQILHYIHYAPIKRGEYLLPESFGIVDKSYIMLYYTDDFSKYILNPEYFKDIKSPSAPHPKLERDLFMDTAIQVEPLHVLSDYDKVWDELNLRGAYAHE